MDMGLAGKKVLLTGGSSGIGRAMVQSFAAEGCDVAFTYFGKADAAATLAEELRNLGRTALGYCRPRLGPSGGA